MKTSQKKEPLTLLPCSEGRRAIEQGGVSIDGEKITDIKHTVSKDTLTGDGVVLKRGKKKFNRVYAK